MKILNKHYKELQGPTTVWCSVYIPLKINESNTLTCKSLYTSFWWKMQRSSELWKFSSFYLLTVFLSVLVEGNTPHVKWKEWCISGFMFINHMANPLRKPIFHFNNEICVLDAFSETWGRDFRVFFCVFLTLTV